MVPRRRIEKNSNGVVLQLVFEHQRRMPRQQSKKRRFLTKNSAAEKRQQE